MFFNLFLRKSQAERLADIDSEATLLKRIMEGKEYSPTMSGDQAKQKREKLEKKRAKLQKI